MLAKCANPACDAPFRYLHEGKLFRLDRGAGPPALSGHMPRQLQYFWLCEQCARTMTLEIYGGKVIARPLPGRGESRPSSGAAAA
jgi:hypothetical protein